MSNSLLIHKLNSAINSQMCAFLSQVATKYGMDLEPLESDWSKFSGMKPKTKKPTGPSLADLRAKCKKLDIPSAGTKVILQDRIDAFERGEIQTITARREAKKKTKEESKPKTKPKTKTKKKSKDSSKSNSSSKSTSSTSSNTSVASLKEQLKEAGLPRTGNKAALEHRLAEHNESIKSGKVNYHTWKIGKLRQEMKNRHLKIKPGTNKDQIVTILQDYDKNPTKKPENCSSDSSDTESSDCDSTSCSECSDSDCSSSDSEDDEQIEKLRKDLEKVKTKAKDGEKSWIKHPDGHWGPK